MQSAYDRDDYVKIQWEHIQPGLEHNFFKYNSTEVSHFNSTYDYKSVMHYSGLAFSKDGIATIVPLVSIYHNNQIYHSIETFFLCRMNHSWV